MLHSIIIPYRNRPRRLRLCVERLAKAADFLPPSGDVEIILVHDTLLNESQFRALTFDHEPLHSQEVFVGRSGKFFNKPRLQNAGIKWAKGEILTFLDVDSLVGRCFFHGAEMALYPQLTKVCYRVRQIAEEGLEKAEQDPAYIDHQFHGYEGHAIRFEAHTNPDMDCLVGYPVFGNSQFSIHRDKLGDTRFREDFEGAGYEDIVMNFDIWDAHDDYDATILTDPDHAILDIQNTREPDWGAPERFEANRNLRDEIFPWINIQVG